MSEIPNTDSFKGTALAVAWGIVKETFTSDKSITANKKSDDTIKELTHDVINVYRTILKNTTLDNGAEVIESPFDF